MIKRFLSLIMFAMTVNATSAQELYPEMKPYAHMLGDFKVTMLMPDGSGNWQNGGEGKASFTAILGGRCIEENIASGFGQGTLTMKNIIGVDGREKKFRLMAMDKEFGVMDMYNGKAENDDLVFDNLTSDKRFETPDGQKLAFRLTFSFENEDTHYLLVEFTNDEGKSWRPYAKTEYKRIG